MYTSTYDPLMSVDEGRCFILDMPTISDEAALELSQLLERFTQAFDEFHHAQLLRAYREREEARRRLYEELHGHPGQQWLPFEEFDEELNDELPF